MNYQKVLKEYESVFPHMKGKITIPYVPGQMLNTEEWLKAIQDVTLVMEEALRNAPVPGSNFLPKNK